MKEFPHYYQTSIVLGSPDDRVRVGSPGLEEIETAPPREFDGPGDRWSPETLLLAAVADCFVLGFKAIAAASRLEWRSLDVQVKGKLDRVERKMKFTEVSIVATATVPESAEARAPRILEKAEESCLITNSLSATVHFEGRVTRS